MTCGDLHTISDEVLRVAGRLAVQLPELLGVFQLHRHGRANQMIFGLASSELLNRDCLMSCASSKGGNCRLAMVKPLQKGEA